MAVVDVGANIPRKRTEDWVLIGTGSFGIRGVVASLGIAYLDAKAKFNKATEVITLSGKIVAGHRVEHSAVIGGHFSKIKLRPVP